MLKYLFFLMFTVGAFAQQQQSPLMTVRESDLPPDVLAKLREKQKVENFKENVTTWAGIGKEVGEAVNGALSAVVVQAENFGKTEVGQFTMILVAWKVLGNDAMHIGWGLIFFTISMSFLFYSYRKTCVVQSVERAWFPFGKTIVTYRSGQREDRSGDIDLAGRQMMHFITFLLIALITSVTIFAG